MSKLQDFLGSGIGCPLSVENDQMVLKSNEALIEDSIKIILSTRPGERLMRPDFGCGIHAYAFAENSVTTATVLSNRVKTSLEQWEPRIEVQSVNVNTDDAQANRLLIDISYKIKTSNAEKNLVYPFYLQGAS